MGEFESLPVELIAEILGELDLESLITVSYLSRRLHSIASDSSLNPWRRPILRNLLQHPDVPYESCLSHLSVRSTVPRQNWIEIMSLGRAEWLLLEATPPHLKEAEWEECFRRRFLPGWQKWKKDGTTWRSTFRKYAAFPITGIFVPLELRDFSSPVSCTVSCIGPTRHAHPMSPGQGKRRTPS